LSLFLFLYALTAWMSHGGQFDCDVGTVTWGRFYCHTRGTV